MTAGMLTQPGWLQAATQLLGTREVVGPDSNPIIVGWTQRMQLWIRQYYTDDDIPWCALFVNHCLLEAGIKGTNSLAARSFETWGVPLGEPALGAVLVFTRAGGGHVGFYVGERADAFRVRGGNQSNTVSDTWVAKSRLTAIRWPASLPLPIGGRIALSVSGSVSSNEV
jgi:uncharacterized protein (TIGR02594 family)